MIWIIFIPVLIYAYDQPLHRTLRLAFFYSMVYWLMTLFWLIAFHEVSMPFITPIYSLYNALGFFLIIVLSKRYKKIRFLFLPLVWVSLEILRSSGYLGFKWNLVGDALWKTPVLMQTADIWGVYGLSFIVLLVNSVLAEFVHSWIEKGNVLKALKRNKVALSVTTGLMSFVLIYGVIQYNRYSRITIDSPQEKIALLQPNQPSFDRDWLKEQWINYYDMWDLHAEASLEDPDMIVWSEVMFKSFLLTFAQYNENHPYRKFADRVLAFPTEFNVPVLMTFPLAQTKDRKREYFNTVSFIQPGQKSGPLFSKIHLTPFGEWFPLYQYIPFVNKMMEKLGAGAYTPAKDFVIFSSKKAKFASMICFEDVFGLMARKYVRRGVNYFVNSTNDGWAYRWSVGSDFPLWQHISDVVGVAVSVRRPIARAVNTGVSGFVDASGDIRVSSIPIYQRGVYVDNIAVIDENIHTIYVRFGFLFPYLVLIVLLGFVVHWTFSAERQENY